MVQVKKGDLVRIEYTGRLATNGAVFETTDEKLARDLGIYRQESAYGPKLAAFGTSTVMVGLEEAIASSTLGKQEEFSIVPEKAFGLKYPNLVRVMSEKDFARQQIIPVAGSIVMLDNIAAKIKSVESGRVVVDFNHPLAGEPVVYSLKVVEVIGEPEKKLKEMLVSLGINGTVSKSGKGFSVAFAASEPAQKVQAAKKAIEAIVPGTVCKTS